METTTLFPGMDAAVAADDGLGREGSSAPRRRRAERAQVLLEPVCLEDRLPPDPPARRVWPVVERRALA